MLYVLSTVPETSDGGYVDVAPGMPIPEDAIPAKHPEFYAGRAWAQGIVCRACPDLCVEGD